MSSPEGGGGAPLYVSTGHLPAPEKVRALVDEAYERYKSVSEGENSSVYPALARVPSDLFGVCVVGTSGNVYAVGDAEHEFTIMSVSKPFVFALVCEAIGHDEARRRLGVNATGLPFNSLGAIEQSGDGRTNPMVNSGAIATTSLVPGATLDAKWQFIHEGLSRFAGRTLPLNDEVYTSATATNFRNQSIARLLQSYERVYMDPAEATALYTKQCSLNVSARDLAVMGATLADGGVNPLTKERLVDPIICHYTLAVMATAGLYETSGDWLYDIGLPRHHPESRRRGRHGGSRRAPGRPAEQHDHVSTGRQSEAADRDPGATRSRQHQLRHQRPAARGHAGHDGDP
jgi:glutaminase